MARRPRPCRSRAPSGKGLRLRVQLQGGFAGTLLDIRTKPTDAGSSVLDPERAMQPPDATGAAALLVIDDQHEGAAAVLVVVRDGQVVAKEPLVIGVEGGVPPPKPGRDGPAPVGGIDPCNSTHSTNLPPRPSTASSSARTWCAGSRASIRCRPMWASSCSGATAPAPIKRRFRRVWRSCSASSPAARCAPVRRNCSRRAPSSRAGSS